MSKPQAKSRRGTQTGDTTASVAADTHMRPSKVIIYETTKREPVREDNDDDDDDFLEDDAKRPVANP